MKNVLNLMYDEMLNLNGSKPKKLYKKLHAWLHDQNSSKLLNQSKKLRNCLERLV